jgi:hypothetical protein
MWRKCCNNECKINEACKNYVGNQRDAENIQPYVIYNEVGFAKFHCENFLPYIKIILQSKMNDEIIQVRHLKKKIKLIHEIVDNFGQERKPELMKKLKALIN